LQQYWTALVVFASVLGCAVLGGFIMLLIHLNRPPLTGFRRAAKEHVSGFGSDEEDTLVDSSGYVVTAPTTRQPHLQSRSQPAQEEA
jgi:hypothetical protein